MRRSLLPLVLCFLPGLATAGQVTLSPTSFTLDNGLHSPLVVLYYQAGAGMVAFEGELVLPLERAGWIEAQVVPPDSTALDTWCQIVNGRVRASLISLDGQALPTSKAVPLCRVRVRTHGFTPRGHYEITPANVYEYTAAGQYGAISTNQVRVVVP